MERWRCRGTPARDQASRESEEDCRNGGESKPERRSYTSRDNRLHQILYGFSTGGREGNCKGKRDWKVMQILFDEPHIDPATLEAITAPTLVMASDHDLIRDEHTLEIYHHIPN